MAVRSGVDTKRIEYLLGLCSQADRERIESEYFEDEDAFQKMLAAEDDLIDAYARGKLTGEERRRFEEHFLSSSQGRKRVQFARAFAGGVSARETTAPATLIGWRAAQKIALIAAVIVVAVVLSWLVIENRRMSRELGDLRAIQMESSKEADALRRAADAERTRAAEISTQLNDLRVQSNEPKERNNTADNRRVSRSLISKVKNVPETIADAPLKPVQAGTLGNTFEPRQITQLPLNASNVVGLLSLQPALTREGYVAGARSDQANITLDGVDINESLLTLIPGAKVDLDVAPTPGWFRLRLILDRPARHTEYRIVLETVDGRQVTANDWIEPVTENQNSIETPVIKTADLPLGDYQLTLMGKEPNGSFMRLAQYTFRIIKN